MLVILYMNNVSIHVTCYPFCLVCTSLSCCNVGTKLKVKWIAGDMEALVAQLYETKVGFLGKNQIHFIHSMIWFQFDFICQIQRDRSVVNVLHFISFFLFVLLFIWSSSFHCAGMSTIIFPCCVFFFPCEFYQSQEIYILFIFTWADHKSGWLQSVINTK